MPTAAVLGSRAAVVAVTGPLGTESVRSNPSRRNTTMRMSDDPALGDYDDSYIASTLRSESSTFLLDQTILFTTRDAPEHDALEKTMSRRHQIDHWLAPDFAGAIMFDEGDAAQHAAGHESKCRAHDNLNAIPQAASVADMAAA